MSSLKPCAHCGGPAMLHSYHEAEDAGGMNRVYWVTCDATKPGHCQAGVGVPVNDRQSEAEAIAAWNRRASEAELVAALRDVDKLWKQGILAMHENEIDRIHRAVRALLAKHGS